MLTTARFAVRPMSELDIDQVVAIERESFPATWPATAYRRELSNQLAKYLVVIDRAQPAVTVSAPLRRSLLRLWRRPPPQPPLSNDYLVGYVGVWFMVNEAHIVSIAVRESYRRRGLGELLLSEALDLALANKQESVTLEVRRSNESAQALYEKYRFLKVGVRRRYYSDNNEDAIIMATPPIQHASFTERLDYLRQTRERRWSENDRAEDTPDAAQDSSPSR